MLTNEQLQADLFMLKVDPSETYTVDQIETLEELAEMNRIASQNGIKPNEDYGELNWIAKGLGIPFENGGEILPNDPRYSPIVGGNNEQGNG